MPTNKKPYKKKTKKLMETPFAGVSPTNQEPFYIVGNKKVSESELIEMFPKEFEQYQMAYGGKIPQYGFGEWLGSNAGAIGTAAGAVIGSVIPGAGTAAGAAIGGAIGGGIQAKYEKKQEEKKQKELEEERLRKQQEYLDSQSNIEPELPVERRKAESTGMFLLGGNLPYKAMGGATSPEFEAEKDEVIQADGMQIHGGGGDPRLNYQADGMATIKGANHTGPSTDPNSGVKMSTSNQTEGRIFSKRLKNPVTKKSFAKEAEELTKKIGKYEEVINNPNAEAIAKRTAKKMKEKYDFKLDRLFETQETLKQEKDQKEQKAQQGNSELDISLPSNTFSPEELNIMQQKTASNPAEMVMPQIPGMAYGGDIPSMSNIHTMYANLPNTIAKGAEFIPNIPEKEEKNKKSGDMENTSESYKSSILKELNPNVDKGVKNQDALKQIALSGALNTIVPGAGALAGTTGAVPTMRKGGSVNNNKSYYKVGNEKITDGMYFNSKNDALGLKRYMYGSNKLPQHVTGAELQMAGMAVGALSPLPAMVHNFVQGSKDPYEWERLQNEQQARALQGLESAQGNLDKMGNIASDMDAQALKDYQASRDIYNQMGDLDVSQQRADVKGAAGSQMNMLRGNASSLQELLAGSQNIQNQKQSQLGGVEAYKNKMDLQTQAQKAQGLAGLGSADARLQAQKASLFGNIANQSGNLGMMFNNIGAQERAYLQSLNEADRYEQLRREAQKTQGIEDVGTFLSGAGESLTGIGTFMSQK